jgi:hypothetical protein
LKKKEREQKKDYRERKILTESKAILRERRARENAYAEEPEPVRPD